VSDFEREPTIATQVSLQTLADDQWHSHPAVIADLTRQELWLAIDQPVGRELEPGRAVRIALQHANGPLQTADTIVLWHIAGNGAVVGLRRPRLWEPPSRREHARARLSVPVYLKVDEHADPIPAISSNIGVGGVFCTAAIPVRIAQRLDVAIQLTPKEAFECQAEVARIDKDPGDPTGHSIGLHFLGLDQETQARLAHTLAELAEGVDDDYVPKAWRPASEQPWDMDAETVEMAATLAAETSAAEAAGASTDDASAVEPAEIAEG
jgi:hypothetical protein